MSESSAANKLTVHNANESFEWQSFAEQRLSQSNLSARSLVVTFFGDIVSVHGGWIWLGSLIEVLESIGISERLVRTSVFRLVKDDWLQAKKQGRRSYYAFTDRARQVYLQAAKRIYSSAVATSADNWTLILPTAIADDATLQEFRKQISWMGFNRLANGLWAHPGLAGQKDIESLKATLVTIGVLDKVILFQRSTIAPESEQLISRQVYQQWGLEKLALDWQDFVKAYTPVVARLHEQSVRLTGRGALVVRLLAVHEYRRILLKDYDLPKSMLPDNWVGEKATEVLSVIYRQLSGQTEQYIREHLESESGMLTSAESAFHQRFQ